MQKIAICLIWALLILSACTPQTATPTPAPSLPTGTALRPLNTAIPETPVQQNSNLQLSVTAEAVDLYDCPQETCSIIGRLEQAATLTAISRANEAAGTWIEVAHQGRPMGWIKLDPQTLDYPHGMWDSLNLQQFIVATATP